MISHYNGQKGRFLPFSIPDDLLSGTTTPADFTPAGHQWRYAAKPTADDVSVDGGTNLHNLTVELETVPPENTIAQGVRLRVRATLQVGSPLLGIFISAESALTAGAATAGTTLADLLTVTATLATGITNDYSPFTATATLVAGAAAGVSIDVAAIAYSQSSLWSGLTAASNAGMTNGVYAETVQTGTNYNNHAWVQMDLGAVLLVATIYVGSDFDDTLQGGTSWGKSYTENKTLQYSNDATTWTDIGSTGTFSAGIKTFSVSFSARYIRIITTAPGGDYLVVTEFYAISS